MSATIQDIADHLGLSSSTVSRVLNTRSRSLISKSTTSRVLKAAQEMRYRPNYTARALATGKTNMIAYWSPDFRATYANQVAHQIHRLLKEQGYETIMSELNPSKAKPFGEHGLMQWKVDGIIINGLTRWLDASPSRAIPRDIPVVRISSEPDDFTDLVAVDLYAPSLRAMQLLLQSGRQRIAHLLTESTHFAGGRHQAYQDAMAEAGRRPELILTTQGIPSDSRHAVKQYIQANGCPDAIFCANDEMAIGAYRGLRDLGLRIPDDAALVGCDGIDLAEYLDTPITTIVQPVEQMCHEAWRLLQARMKHPDAPIRKVSLEAKLVVRESSGQRV